MQDILLLGNGRFPSKRLLRHLTDRASRVVCCDGAASKFIRAGGKPSLVIGDMDSLSPRLRRRLPARTLVPVPEQDTTDLEKALRYLRKRNWRGRKVLLAGFTGKRPDLTLYNLNLLSGNRMMVNDNETVFRAKGRTQLRPLFPGARVSLLPLSRVRNLTTTGLEWDLEGSVLEPGGRMSISNRAVTDRVTLVHSGGTLLVFIANRPGRYHLD